MSTTADNCSDGENTLRVKSCRSDTTVSFQQIGEGDLRVSVVAIGHSATRDVYAYTDLDGIGRMFRKAANSWKGWGGKKSWESIEGDLRLELTSDQRGHILLSVVILNDFGAVEAWEHRFGVELEFGQLEQIAREAERLWPPGKQT